MDEVEHEFLDVDNFSPPISLAIIGSAVGKEEMACRDNADDQVVVEVHAGGEEDEHTSEGRAEIEKDVTVNCIDGDERRHHHTLSDAGDGGGERHNRAVGSGGENDHEILARAGAYDGRSHTVTQSVDDKSPTRFEASVEGCSLWAGGEDSDGRDYNNKSHEDGEEQQAVGRASTDLPCPESVRIIVNTSDEDTSSRTDDEDDDDYSDSHLSNGSNRESHMSADSEDGFDLLRTLRHYRRRRRRSSDSSTSESDCSCDSCISRSNWKFFDSEEGPPGGEDTIYRRAALWMDGMKYLMGILMYGLLLFTVLLTTTALWLLDFKVAGCKHKGACKVLYWAIPLTVVMVMVILAWHISQCILLRRGYGKGNHLIERENIIHYAKSKEVVYSIRGAIYAPTKPAPKGSTKPPKYEVVAYDGDYSTSSYFDSDLEADGQYRRNIAPWREVADPATSERRNIYTRKAWFRDMPIIWWEMCTQPPRDF